MKVNSASLFQCFLISLPDICDDSCKIHTAVLKIK